MLLYVKFLIAFVPLFLLQLLSGSVWAAEKVGQFEIDMIRLRPTWLSDEEAGASFSLSDSAAGFRWRKDKAVSVYMGVGSELQRNLPIYYAAENNDQFGFYEMYAEYSGIYGKWRAGLIPLHFGYDGVIEQHKRYFNRALHFTERAAGLTDHGASFYTEHNGHYTEIIAHNGEIDTPSDGRLWVTGRWGYDNGRRFRTQLSMQTGYVKGELSEGNTENSLGGVVNGENAKWRNGLLFVNWYSPRWSIVAQTGGGVVEQDERVGSYASHTIDFTYFISSLYGGGIRYDEFDPNTRLKDDKSTELTLAMVFKSKDSTSEVYLLGTKVFEEARERDNDQLRLVWLLTPFPH